MMATDSSHVVAAWLEKRRLEVSWLVAGLGLLLASFSMVFAWLSSAEEQRAHQTVQRLVQGLDHTGIGVCIVDKNGIVTDWSVGMEKITGFTVDEARGYMLGHIIPPEARNIHKEALGQYMRKYSSEKVPEKAVVKRVECSVLTKDLKRVPVVISVILTNDDNGDPMAMGLVVLADAVQDIRWSGQADKP